MSEPIFFPQEGQDLTYEVNGKWKFPKRICQECMLKGILIKKNNQIVVLIHLYFGQCFIIALEDQFQVENRYFKEIMFSEIVIILLSHADHSLLLCCWSDQLQLLICQSSTQIYYLLSKILWVGFISFNFSHSKVRHLLPSKLREDGILTNSLWLHTSVPPASYIAEVRGAESVTPHSSNNTVVCRFGYHPISLP